MIFLLVCPGPIIRMSPPKCDIILIILTRNRYYSLILCYFLLLRMHSCFREHVHNLI